MGRNAGANNNGNEKAGNSTRILPHSDYRKARRANRAHTRDTKLGRDTSSEEQGATSPNGLAHHDTSTDVIGRDWVTSQLAMNVTPPRRGYMRSPQQRSCYLERQSREGGAPAVLKPLALTYHFGRETSMPDGSRTSGITGRRPQTAVENNIAERDGADNIISNTSTAPSFVDVRRVHYKKRYGAENIILEASATPSVGEVRGVYPKKKI